MGTTLTGTTPQDTYDSLIKVTDNGPLSGTAKYLSDGLGNDSALALSTSKVGIGTASPTGKLTVSSGTAGGGYNSDYDELVLSNAGRAGINILSSATEYTAIIMGGAADNVTGGIYHKADTKMLSLATNDTFRMNIDSAGNVGIGTTSPDASLTVSSGTANNVANFKSTDALAYVAIADNSSSTALGNHIAVVGDNMYFATNDTERVRILSTGGITFNGDTAAANALDDYEEGTWTMGVAFGGASVGITYNFNTGSYTKVGRQVTVNGILSLSSKGSSTGAAIITGLPFTVANGIPFYATASLRLENVTFANQFQAFASVNSTYIELEEVTALGSKTLLTDADFANNSTVMVSLTYFV